jgi:hypothetical protein
MTDMKNLVHELNLGPILLAQLELKIRLLLEFCNFFAVISELRVSLSRFKVQNQPFSSLE